MVLAGDATIRAVSDPLDPELLSSDEMRAALVNCDIGTVYHLLTKAGISQRRIAELLGQSQSEVSEILRDARSWLRHPPLRRERVRNPARVDGSRLRRGHHRTCPGGGGAPQLPCRRGLHHLRCSGVRRPKAADPAGLVTKPPECISAQDVVQYEQTVTRLNMLDREAAGMAAREALAAKVDDHRPDRVHGNVGTAVLL